MAILINTSGRILSFCGGNPAKGGVTLEPKAETPERVKTSDAQDANLKNDRTLLHYIATGEVIDVLETFKGAEPAEVIPLERPSRSVRHQPAPVATVAPVADFVPPAPVKQGVEPLPKNKGQAIPKVAHETDLETLKAWFAVETRQEVKDAIEARGNFLMQGAQQSA